MKKLPIIMTMVLTGVGGFFAGGYAMVSRASMKSASAGGFRTPVDSVIGLNDPSIGSELAPVTIVVFSDFSSPFGRKTADTLNRIIDAYPRDVRVVFKFAPTTPEGKLAAEAALAAHAQGRFWAYHDALFATRRDLDEPTLRAHASRIGLDEARFAEDLSTHAFAAHVEQDQADAERIGVTATPTLFVNGTPVAGVKTFEQLRGMVDEEIRAAHKR